MTIETKKDLASQERGLFLSRLRGNDGKFIGGPLSRPSSPLTPSSPQYRGRFAPSPSGPLHLGSLIAAVASYCQAKANDGIWLVRMEDIDPPREQVGADKLIMDCLNAHGLISDEPIVYQSQRVEVYAAAIHFLATQDKIFYCSCTRKALRAQQAKDASTTIYPGTCRQQRTQFENCSTRLLVDDEIIYSNDAVYGLQTQELATEVGDFVLQRRDGLFSYQLAVVIDDIAQGITEVVRGVDLLDSTARQIYLYKQLGYTAPDYLHLPLALLDDGKKLSKQTGALAVDNAQASLNLFNVLQFLGQEPPTKLKEREIDQILQWGIEHWDVSKISTESKIFSP